MRYILLLVIIAINNCDSMERFWQWCGKKEKDKTCHLAKVPLLGPGEEIALYARINDLEEHVALKKNQYHVSSNNALIRNHLVKECGLWLPVTEQIFNFSQIAKAPYAYIHEFAINKSTIVAACAKYSTNAGDNGNPDIDYIVADSNDPKQIEYMPVFRKDNNKNDSSMQILGLAISNNGMHIASIEQMAQPMFLGTSNDDFFSARTAQALLFRSKISNIWTIMKEIELPLTEDYCAVEFFEEHGLVGLLKDNGAVKLIEIPKEMGMKKTEIPLLLYYLRSKGVCKNLTKSK